ncbi:UvrABC system protein C [Marine Group I thaumarchaeote SCGC AAA799-E16]|uniref:UvrABC system protein C n=4 Tax=Marine Group I TaxID=905826 RepID=A0A081RL32_9ARCH|nr:UvrABC system protein C [Marine Group I thaumarchaeote SCGC AAA799-N04]KER05758.1 UvrABC system protein C [Marine Group I thaumarchaeote SCGC AAA799-E16]KFM15621.1 UvrABC system protein C [Marine Group I thaumarchaeote SCGC AAA799-D11]KFM15784.1 UvrABC system protein C [Marine Group I thaumarchaeote SCGC RSA3]
MEILDDKIRIWLESAKFVKPVSGVYVLYNRKKEAIYIGESQNLQQTFTKYVDTDFENNLCKQKTHSYQREFVDNTKERKEILLEDFKDEHNGKIPICNDIIMTSSH